MCFQIHTDGCGCSLSDTDWSFYVGRSLMLMYNQNTGHLKQTRYTNRWDVLAVKAGFLLGGRGDGGVTGGVTRWAGLLGQNLGKVTGHTSAVWPARATTWQTVRRRTRTLCSCTHKSEINILLYIYVVSEKMFYTFRCVMIHTHRWLTAGLVLQLVFLDAGADERSLPF